MKSNIFITGFSGAGKSTVGREVARRLGWTLVELDDEIVRAAGKSIEAVFREDGESSFRRIEAGCLDSVAARERQVVSTGGGVPASPRNRAAMRENGIVVCLEASPETILDRLEREGREARGPVVRPMLEAEDPAARVRALKAERQPAYALADWTVHTDRLSPATVAEEVARAWTSLSARAEERDGPSTGSGRAETQMTARDEPVEPRVEQDGPSTGSGRAGEAPSVHGEPVEPCPDGSGDLAAIVRTSVGDYPVRAGWGALDGLGEMVRDIVGARTAYLVSDEGVYSHARRAQNSLEAAGIRAHLVFIPQGEAYKTLDTARLIYGWLADHKAERGHVVVAVGGGVVGDLAGFVAATNVRGMPLVQVPTTLLAMMDAAIGGKVAVDLPQGKNLVGAFHQPRLVLADPATLETLPGRERASGWAEAIKHGLILDRDLLESFERDRAAILALEREVTEEVIRRSVAVKARVVSQDERETLGVRVLLNYGHTIGHAIEAVTGYRRFLHGEAVSIGMMGAAYISQGMGLLPERDVRRQQSLLEAFGLPVRYGPEIDAGAIREAMRSDKKTTGGSIRWVLLEALGSAVTRSDVPDELVDEALARLALRQPADA